jgi:hypothetical protein
MNQMSLPSPVIALPAVSEFIGVTKDMRWLIEAVAGYSRWMSRRQNRPERQSRQIAKARLAMLDMLGDEGLKRYPEVVRRICTGRDAQTLWYARADLMAALADLYGEQTASARMASLTALFEGMLPKGMMSRPTTLGASE